MYNLENDRVILFYEKIALVRGHKLTIYLLSDSPLFHLPPYASIDQKLSSIEISTKTLPIIF